MNKEYQLKARDPLQGGNLKGNGGNMDVRWVDVEGNAAKQTKTY